MRTAPQAWPGLTDEVRRRYIAFLLSTLPKLAAAALPRWRSIGRRRSAVLRAALRQAAPLEGIGLEFGVYNGGSLRLSGRTHPGRRFYGFDSFTGFPEDDRPDWQMDFATRALPEVPPNCTLVPGWFDETVPAMLAATSGPVAFVNIDCDLYSSAHTALVALRGRLALGAVLYFDELLNYDTALWNEMLALFEFLEATGMGVRWIATQRKVRPLATTLDLLADRRFPDWKADVRAGYGRAAAAVLVARNEDGGSLDDGQNEDVERMAARFGELTERLRGGRLVDRYCEPDPPHRVTA